MFRKDLHFHAALLFLFASKPKHDLFRCFCSFQPSFGVFEAHTLDNSNKCIGNSAPFILFEKFYCSICRRRRHFRAASALHTVAAARVRCRKPCLCYLLGFSLCPQPNDEKNNEFLLRTHLPRRTIYQLCSQSCLKPYAATIVRQMFVLFFAITFFRFGTRNRQYRNEK